MIEDFFKDCTRCNTIEELNRALHKPACPVDMELFDLSEDDYFYAITEAVGAIERLMEANT